MDNGWMMDECVDGWMMDGQRHAPAPVSAPLPGLTCLGVPALVGDLVDGVQESLLVAVRVELKLGASVIAELGDGHLSGMTRNQSTNNNNHNLVSTSQLVSAHFHMLLIPLLVQTPPPRPQLPLRPERYLGAVRSDLVQGTRRTVQEANDLDKVVIADAPGAVDQEDQVGPGCSAHLGGHAT